MTGIVATSIRRIPRREGAYWYGAANTRTRGSMFVKVPLGRTTGGHDGSWQELIALGLARAVGLPALQPHRVQIPQTLMSSEDRARTFWGNGDVFCATALQRNAHACGYDRLGRDKRALLYAFDNYLLYGDRSDDRLDCHVGDDGRVIVFDWDTYPAPGRAGRGVPIDVFNWATSGFLVSDLPGTLVRRACEVVVEKLRTDVLIGAVARAAESWACFQAPVVSAWLSGRRDSLVRAWDASQSRS